MRNTNISILSVTFALALGGCTADEAQTSTTAFGLSAGTCETTPDFPTWDDLEKVKEKEPDLYKAAFEAATLAGDTCLNDERYGCQPELSEEDILSKKWVFPFVGCWKDTDPQSGRLYAECCLVGVPGDRIVCGWSWINVGPTVPPPPPENKY